MQDTVLAPVKCILNSKQHKLLQLYTKILIPTPIEIQQRLPTATAHPNQQTQRRSGSYHSLMVHNVSANESMLKRLFDWASSYLLQSQVLVVVHHQPLLEVNTGIVVSVNRLAEVDGIAEFLFQDWLAGGAGDLEQEETGIGFWEVVVGWMVLV